MQPPCCFCVVRQPPVLALSLHRRLLYCRGVQRLRAAYHDLSLPYWGAAWGSSRLLCALQRAPCHSSSTLLSQQQLTAGPLPPLSLGLQSMHSPPKLPSTPSLRAPVAHKSRCDFAPTHAPPSSLASQIACSAWMRRAATRVAVQCTRTVCPLLRGGQGSQPCSSIST